METAIYYFSGTGNSLFVANTLNKKMSNSKLHPILSTLNANEIACNAPKVGIVFPMHFMTLPRVVDAFLEKIKLPNAHYVFVVITGEKPSLGNAVSRVKHILQNRGVALDAAFFIPMVAAHFPVFRYAKPQEAKVIYNAAMQKVTHILTYINEGKPVIEKEKAMLSNLKQMMFPAKEGKQRHFWREDGCIRCGYCVQVCPFQNITLKGKEVIWHDNCHSCFACVHYCSKSVIHYKKLSKNKKRHHHPMVGIADISQQRG